MQNEAPGPSHLQIVRLTAKGLRWRRTGHPWVYRNDLEDLPEIPCGRFGGRDRPGRPLPGPGLLQRRLPHRPADGDRRRRAGRPRLLGGPPQTGPGLSAAGGGRYRRLPPDLRRGGRVSGPGGGLLRRPPGRPDPASGYGAAAAGDHRPAGWRTSLLRR